MIVASGAKTSKRSRLTFTGDARPGSTSCSILTRLPAPRRRSPKDLSIVATSLDANAGTADASRNNTTAKLLRNGSPLDTRKVRPALVAGRNDRHNGVIALRAAGDLRETPHARAVRRRQSAGLHAPRPVAARRAGKIHARFAAEIEDVLHRHDRGLRDRRECDARESRRDVVRFASEVLARERALVVGRAVEPSARGVVVMSPAVDDGARLVAMRQMRRVE